MRADLTQKETALNNTKEEIETKEGDMKNLESAAAQNCSKFKALLLGNSTADTTTPTTAPSASPTKRPSTAAMCVNHARCRQDCGFTHADTPVRRGATPRQRIGRSPQRARKA